VDHEDCAAAKHTFSAQLVSCVTAVFAQCCQADVKLVGAVMICTNCIQWQCEA